MTEPMPPAPAEAAPATRDPGGRPLAGWGRRLAAYLLDALFSSLVGLAAGAVAGGLVGLVVHVLAGEDAVEAAVVTGIVLGYLVLLVVVATYYTYLHGNERGQTWAKSLLGIRVRDEATGGRIGYGRAFGAGSCRCSSGTSSSSRGSSTGSGRSGTRSARAGTTRSSAASSSAGSP